VDTLVDCQWCALVAEPEALFADVGTPSDLRTGRCDDGAPGRRL